MFNACSTDESDCRQRVFASFRKSHSIRAERDLCAACHIPGSSLVATASASAEGAGWGLSFEKTLTGDDGGQNRSIGIDLLFSSRDLLLQSFRPQFLFSARNILSPENV
jgi:hypothetical protein